MSDRLTAQQQTETAREVAVQVTVASQLADLALNNLELRSDPSIIRINGRALNQMTQTDLIVVNSISTRLAQLQTDASFVESYTLGQFKTDFLKIASFISGPLKKEFSRAVRGLNETQFALIKTSLTSDITSRHAASAASTAAESQAAAAETTRQREASERAGFSPEKSAFLTMPDLKMAKLVSQVEDAGGTEAEKMERLQSRITTKLSSVYNEWINEVRPLMESQTGGGLSTYESTLAEDQLGVQTTSTQAFGKAAGAVGNAAGNVFGDLAQFSFTPLNQHPLLGSIFNTKEAIAAGYAGINTSTNAAETMIATRVAAIMNGLTFENVSSKFVLIPDNLADPDITVEQLQALEEKMETIPKFFRNKDFANQYYDYLRESVGGDLTLARSFKEWFKTVDMHPLMKMFYQFMMMIPDEVMDYFDGRESEKTDEEINGTDLHAIKEELGNRGVTTNTNAANQSAAETREGNLEDQSEYQVLLTQYRAALGDSTATLDIMHEGVILGTNPLTNAEVRSLTSVKSLLEKEPQAAPMLDGANLKDLVFMADHYGDSNDDGINVRFEGEEVLFSADYDNLFRGQALTGDWSTEAFAGFGTAGLAALAGAGALTGGLAWVLAAGVAGGFAAYYAGESEGTDRTAKITDSPTRIGNIIHEMKIAVETIEADMTRAAAELADLSPVDLAKLNASDGFQSLAQLSEAWSTGFKLTALDAANFVKHEEDETFDNFHEEQISAGENYINNSGDEVEATGDMNIIEANGSGYFKDYMFESAEALFKWLAKQ